MQKEKVIVIDVDRTIARERQPGQSYADLEPIWSVLYKLREYHKQGYYIILYTSREMNKYNRNVGKILARTAPVLFDWLSRYDVPYDEIHFGKPWCGTKGFYVDDKAIRPGEFARLSEDEVYQLLQDDKAALQQMEQEASPDGSAAAR
ncbi:MAG: capsular biosynthesis protein [Firmicutes bacterium]|jgi:capsule biosynthesis phosphatase|nr:capsular biosynthesis protein [Bacillota bacterium]